MINYDESLLVENIIAKDSYFIMKIELNLMFYKKNKAIQTN